MKLPLGNYVICSYAAQSGEWLQLNGYGGPFEKAYACEFAQRMIALNPGRYFMAVNISALYI